MLKYFFLGIVQGLTEFLPVSSSGHLVLLQRILDIKQQQLLNIIILHLATVLSLLVFFFRDIIESIKDWKLALNILVVTSVTGVIAVAGKDYLESLFSSVKMVALGLLITGVALSFTRFFPQGKRKIGALKIKDALVFGFVQAIAVIPGISRSGATISTLLFRGADKDAAFKFSFLASIPAVAGAFILEAKRSNFSFSSLSPALYLGFICAFISGIFALYVLRMILKKAKFHYFGYYCICISLLSWIFLK